MATGPAAAAFSLRVGEHGSAMDMEFADGSPNPEAQAGVTFAVDNSDVEGTLETDETGVAFATHMHRRCLSAAEHKKLVDFISRNRSCPVVLHRITASTGKVCVREREVERGRERSREVERGREREVERGRERERDTKAEGARFKLTCTDAQA